MISQDIRHAALSAENLLVETTFRTSTRKDGCRMSAVARPSPQLITRQRSSAAADAATARVAYQYLVWATVWLLVGTVAGLLPAIKLNLPDFLPTPWLSFGRIRPIHTNTVFWGWSTMALVGLAIYVASRTSRVPHRLSAVGRFVAPLRNGARPQTIGAGRFES